MAEAVLKTEMHDSTAWITINRPKKLNALSMEVVSTMTDTIRKLEADDEVRVIVITGANNSFSVGYDIAEEVRAEIRWAGPARNEV